MSIDLTSTVKIYADDTKIYRTISSPDVDIPALQCHLQIDWAYGQINGTYTLTRINARSCVLHIGRIKPNLFIRWEGNLGR